MLKKVAIYMKCFIHDDSNIFFVGKKNVEILNCKVQFIIICDRFVRDFEQV